MKKSYVISSYLINFIFILLCSSCASTSNVVNLDDTWPTKVGPFDEVSKQWTRSGDIHEGFHQILHVSAIFESPKWKVANINARSAKHLLGEKARSTLLRKAQRESGEGYEVILVVDTHFSRENDLEKENSIWRIALEDDTGNEILPSQIKRDKRPISILQSEFSSATPFSKVYRLRFPKTFSLLGKDKKEIRLKIASNRGGVILRWKNALK